MCTCGADEDAESDRKQGDYMQTLERLDSIFYSLPTDDRTLAAAEVKRWQDACLEKDDEIERLTAELTELRKSVLIGYTLIS